ncbi:MAG: hypothetical protein QM796_15765 [Chthoniobacteraceae bacterium]
MQNALRFLLEGKFGADAVFIDDDDFAGLHLADELGVDEVEGAGLAGEHVGAIELAEAERAEAERIADADDLALGHHDEREGALDLAERGERRRLRPFGWASRWRMISLSTVVWKMEPRCFELLRAARRRS